jgi:hypothetical protein
MDGKPDLEDRAARLSRSNADRAAVRRDDRANDCEAQSGTSLFVASHVVRPRKPPEHELSIRVRDSRPRVLDRQDDLVSLWT